MMYIIRVFVALFAVRRESEPLRCLVVARDVVAVVFALRKLAYERSVRVVKIEVTPAVPLRPMDKQPAVVSEVRHHHHEDSVGALLNESVYLAVNTDGHQA